MGLHEVTLIDAASLVAVLDRSAETHFFTGELWRMEIDSASTILATDATILKTALDLQAQHGPIGIEKLFREVVPALRVERCTRWDVEMAVTALLTAGADARDLVHHLEDAVRTRLRPTRTFAGS
jgi:hypothetical protein